MLRVLAMLVLGLMAVPARAETVKVASGEHAEFTRLVVELPADYSWQLARTIDGYELAIEEAELTFDVSKVFDRIPKTRLIGIFVDPASGNLRLRLDCDCHALPFSLDAKTIVIDLRNGLAPSGSSFELGFDGLQLPPLQKRNRELQRPRIRTPQLPAPRLRYDWLSATPPPAPAPITFPIPELATATSELRESLVAQLADGAARNVVDLDLAQLQPDAQAAPRLPDSVPVRLTSGLGINIGGAAEEPVPMQPEGQACVPDDQLDLESWLTDETRPAPYAGLANQLVGEFDKPDDAMVLTAAKRYIYLGFGVEARTLLQTFPVDSAEAALLLDLSHLVDGDAVPKKASFAGMETCDSAVAFWALLSAGKEAQSNYDEAAIKRTFSALPPHLRRHLGPQVMELLVEIGANDLATEIGQMIGRAQHEDTRALMLAESEVLLADGKAEEALPKVEEVLTDPGQLKAEALITLVDAQIAAETPVDPGVAETLAALLDEYQGHPLHADLARAHGLALAGSGQFEAARMLADAGVAPIATFWTLLARNADDDMLMMQAMQPPTDVSEVPDAAGQAIAKRLSELGFADEAATWQALFPNAEAMMESGSYDNESTAEVDELPATSDAVDTPAIDESVANAAEPQVPTATREARWNEDWTKVAGAEDGTWSALANKLATEAPAGTAPSLERANELLSESQEMRALIDQLLIETQQNETAP